MSAPTRPPLAGRTPAATCRGFRAGPSAVWISSGCLFLRQAPRRGDRSCVSPALRPSCPWLFGPGACGLVDPLLRDPVPPGERGDGVPCRTDAGIGHRPKLLSEVLVADGLRGALQLA